MKAVKYFVLALVLALIAFFLIWKERSAKLSQTLSASPSPTPATASPIPTSYDDWTLFRNGYALPLPPDWKNTSDLGGQAILEPGRKIGSITKIAVTVLSDKKVAEGQAFTSQKELDDWMAKPIEATGTMQKLANITIDGQKGVLLLDKSGGDALWTVINWVRKDETNLYISVYGTGKYSQEEAQAIEYMTQHFTFTAPPSTDKEK